MSGIAGDLSRFRVPCCTGADIVAQAVNRWRDCSSWLFGGLAFTERDSNNLFIVNCTTAVASIAS
jgi:hypothetical protein